MTRLTHALRFLVFFAAVAALLSVRLPARAEDIDLFTINPTVSSQRPNVLIILDSSANWDQTDPVEGGKRSTWVLEAMASTVESLTDQFNVGLMMFAETGNPNDNIDGGVMRMGMRWMSSTNRTALATFFRSIDSGYDKSNNTSMGLAFAEALYYFSGRAAYSGLGKAKRDYLTNVAAGTPHTWADVGASQQTAPAAMQTASNAIWNLALPTGTPLPRNALTDSTDRIYNTPVTDACQKNFIIYIANGPFSDPNASNAEATTRLGAEGGNTETILFTENTGLQGNISDEWARYLSSPNPNNANKPIVVTYTVDINKSTTGQGPNTSQLLKSIANEGKGKYFDVSSADGGAQIAEALKQIFAEIAAVNSVFASSTLPVSVNVRGAFLNQVYMGVFRPDANSSPRWPGNVKHYALGANASGDVFLIDKNGNPIENATTGFVSPNAVSYWTAASTFWDVNYYPEAVAAAPLTPSTSDSPDGEFVEKGGAAQRLRTVYATTINDATSPRKLYTCIGCAPGTSLAGSSDHAFSTANANIDDAAMGITTTKPVTSLVRSGRTVTATATAHGFTNGQTVNVANATGTQYNGDHTVTVTGANTFTYTITELPVSPATAASGQTLTAAKGGAGIQQVSSISLGGTNGNTATVETLAAHGFTTGQSVTITGATQSAYNGTYSIIVTDASHFTYTVTTGPATPATTPGTIVVTRSDGSTASSAISTIARSASTVTVDTASNVFTGTLTCSSVEIAGADPATYRVLGRSCTKTGNKQLIFTLTGAELTPSSPASGTIFADASVVRSISSMTRPEGSGTVTVVTTAAHSFNNGDSIVISGASDARYNGTRTITYDPLTMNTSTFTFSVNTEPATPDPSGTITATGSGNVTLADLVNWVRGENVKTDDNPALAATRVRGYLHGDVLHSRPAVVNYNRSGQPAERDLSVFYGANDGIIHAVKGGANDADGYERWGFVPSEFFTRLARLYNESPIISSSNTRGYFADGPISVLAEYVTDTSVDPPVDRIQGTGARAQIYIGMRRGGRFYYSLDVTSPDAPVFKWKIDNTMAGFEELGQSWSEARVVKLRLASCPGTGVAGACKVIVFGAGYDAAANDPETQGTATMGRGIFVVDAITGERIWHTGPSAISAGDGTYVQTAGMTYAIPADLSVINTDLDVNGYADRIYAADTGGNIWRVNISDSNPANWKVYQVASLRTTDPSAAVNARKFLFAPDAVQFDSSTDSVLIGSGDREHPHETTILNRYYMIKDAHAINYFPADPITPTLQDPASIVREANLCDLTDNNLQGTNADAAAVDRACLDDVTKKGWMIRLVGKDPKFPTDVSKRSPGEKTVTGATTLGGTVIFATNTPKQTTLSTGQCTGSLGTALIYAVSFRDATATVDFDGSGTVGQIEQFTERVGGGFPPTAIPFSVKIGDKFYEGAITGTKVVQPPSAPIGQRYRVFWNLSIDN